MRSYSQAEINYFMGDLEVVLKLHKIDYTTSQIVDLLAEDEYRKRIMQSSKYYERNMRSQIIKRGIKHKKLLRALTDTAQW